MALKDITLGQYFPGHTVIHRLDPRTKLIFTVAYIVALFLARQGGPYAILLVLLGVSFLSFLLMHISPGDPVRAMYAVSGSIRTSASPHNASTATKYTHSPITANAPVCGSLSICSFFSRSP